MLNLQCNCCGMTSSLNIETSDSKVRCPKCGMIFVSRNTENTSSDVNEGKNFVQRPDVGENTVSDRLHTIDGADAPVPTKLPESGHDALFTIGFDDAASDIEATTSTLTTTLTTVAWSSRTDREVRIARERVLIGQRLNERSRFRRLFRYELIPLCLLVIAVCAAWIAVERQRIPYPGLPAPAEIQIVESIDDSNLDFLLKEELLSDDQPVEDRLTEMERAFSGSENLRADALLDDYPTVRVR